MFLFKKIINFIIKNREFLRTLKTSHAVTTENRVSAHCGLVPLVQGLPTGQRPRATFLTL